MQHQSLVSETCNLNNELGELYEILGSKVLRRKLDTIITLDKSD